jgi:tetratricopeptide (TPR) repeat protein
MTKHLYRIVGALKYLLALAVFITATTASATDLPADYEKALDLIHAYSGSGDELRQAMEIAGDLSKAYPNSGYAQTLYAEAASTWRLDQEGKPADIREKIIALCDEALAMNPSLAQAYVAKARSLVRASMYEPANVSIDKALSLQPNFTGAIFLRAEIFRRTGVLSDAEAWYIRFIESTPSVNRKANGYGWIGKMYEDAAWDDARNREKFTAKARQSYETMLQLNPGGAWRNVNFAIFLNGDAADFEAAELYATKALGMMEFPMARYHLAASRYQKIWARSREMSGQEITKATQQVADSTRITLADAISFSSFSSLVRARLIALQKRSTPTIR